MASETPSVPIPTQEQVNSNGSFADVLFDQHPNEVIKKYRSIIPGANLIKSAASIMQQQLSRPMNAVDLAYISSIAERPCENFSWFCPEDVSLLNTLATASQKTGQEQPEALIPTPYHPWCAYEALVLAALHRLQVPNIVPFRSVDLIQSTIGLKRAHQTLSKVVLPDIHTPDGLIACGKLTVNMMIHLMEALCGMSKLGLHHGDISMENILHCGQRWVLCDFNSSSILDQGIMTHRRTTMNVMSPEQLCQAGTGVGGDVWSLGVTLLTLWTKSHANHVNPTPTSAKPLLFSAAAEPLVDIFPFDQISSSIQLILDNPSAPKRLERLSTLMIAHYHQLIDLHVLGISVPSSKFNQSKSKSTSVSPPKALLTIANVLKAMLSPAAQRMTVKQWRTMILPQIIATCITAEDAESFKWLKKWISNPSLRPEAPELIHGWCPAKMLDDANNKSATVFVDSLRAFSELQVMITELGMPHTQQTQWTYRVIEQLRYWEQAIMSRHEPQSVFNAKPSTSFDLPADPSLERVTEAVSALPISQSSPSMLVYDPPATAYLHKQVFVTCMMLATALTIEWVFEDAGLRDVPLVQMSEFPGAGAPLRRAGLKYWIQKLNSTIHVFEQFKPSWIERWLNFAVREVQTRWIYDFGHA